MVPGSAVPSWIQRAGGTQGRCYKGGKDSTKHQPGSWITMIHQHLEKPLAGVPGAVMATGAGKALGHTLTPHCWGLKFQRENLQLLPLHFRHYFLVFSKAQEEHG